MSKTSSTRSPASFNHIETLAKLAETADALGAARADVARLKALMLDQLPPRGDPGAMLRFAIDAYWAFPDLPAESVAELATGLTGRRAIYAFTNGLARRASPIECSTCGNWVPADSRDEMRKVMERGYGRCEDCRPSPAVAKELSYERGPVSNDRPNALTRDVLEAHICNKASALVNVAWISGGSDVSMSPEVMRRFLEDPDDGAAAAVGVSKSDYLAWLEAEGGVQCCGRTRTGGSCRNRLYGGWGEKPSGWVLRQAAGVLCAVHA